jgi:hypothetical protein
LETGQWWLADTQGARAPLADRVEIAAVRYLIRNPNSAVGEVDRALCAVFPGLLTPPPSLVGAILASYGEEQDGRWQIAEGDQPRGRRADLREMRAALAALGTRLGYTVSGELPLAWADKGSPVFNFFVIASAVIGDILLKSAVAAKSGVVVVPGRRAQLALYKLQRDPRFDLATKEGWRFIKFRHVRRLAENRSLTRESFEELLEIDPLTLENLQAPLL